MWHTWNIQIKEYLNGWPWSYIMLMKEKSLEIFKLTFNKKSWLFSSATHMERTNIKEHPDGWPWSHLMPRREKSPEILNLTFKKKIGYSLLLGLECSMCNAHAMHITKEHPDGWPWSHLNLMPMAEKTLQSLNLTFKKKATA